MNTEQRAAQVAHTPGPLSSELESIARDLDTCASSDSLDGVLDGVWEVCADLAVDVRDIARRQKAEESAAFDLLAALKGVMQHCVTPTGMPDLSKGRTQEQHAAYELARAAIAKAEGGVK